MTRIILLAVSLLTGLWVATQHAAGRLRHPYELRGRVYRGDTWSVYLPWALLTWIEPSVAGSVPVRQTKMAFFVYALALVGVITLTTRRGGRDVPAFGAGAWGDRRDLKRAGLLGGRGTVVGVHDGRLLTYDGPEHQLVSGASRSGKGVGHVIPTLLCWPDSALVYDVKGELWEATAGYRSRYQHCLFFNPTRNDSAHLNPLMEVRKGPGEVRDVQNLVEMLINPDGSKKTLDVWDQNASQFLVGLILHVLYTEPPERKNLGRVRAQLLDFTRTCEAMMTTPHRLNLSTGEPEVYPEVARVARSLLTQAERFRSSVRGTAEGYLTLWADETVCEVTSRSDFTVGDLVCCDRPMTLYLQPPPSDADRVRPLMRLMLNQVARALLEHRTQDARGRAKRHRLLMLIDEFPTLGKLPFFADALRQMAGYGLKAHLIVQSFNDIVGQYGPHNTIVDNCHVLVSFASADTFTQQRISQMTGEVAEYRDSYSRPRSLLANGHRSVSQAEHVRPLLQPGQVRTLGYDEQLIFVTGFKPFRTPKLRYFEVPALQTRVIAPPDPASMKRMERANENDWNDERAKGEPVSLSEVSGRSEDEDDESSTTVSSAVPTTTDNEDEQEGGFF
ncbi:MAG TPA: type IV secretory system conjugative DNA transfer family protein [Lacipirellulaceae bacterium]|nr:type IV secretory system conjugative DNA transfer family protein [Lacipirellulaceae bacterium]